jgi:primary-amine oxidase
VRAGATGTTLNRGVPDVFTGDAFSTLVAPNIAAPAHQHFFSFRIDFDVDGTSNRVVEENTRGVASNLDNQFVTDETVLGTEGFRDANPASTRRWVVESATRSNALGTPTGYELEPGDITQPYSEPSYVPLQHAPFARHAFWVTQYRDGELSSVGDYPNQGSGGEGLDLYANGQSVNNRDVVVWWTAAFTHDPRVEDFPVMPRDITEFKLRPNGFFDENPALDVPEG